MKTTMKPMILAAALTIAALSQANAFYDPHIGRWASRDPIGETGGYNVYAFIHNDPCGHIDPLGLIRFGDDNWGCRICVCKSVTITYEPGGNNMELDWYNIGLDLEGDLRGDLYRFGNKMHVKWTVLGDPRECRYYQDEGATRTTIEYLTPSPFPPFTEVGEDGHVVDSDYYDFMGVMPPPGTSVKWTLHWDVVFRCVSSKPWQNTVTHRVTKSYFPVIVDSKDNPNKNRR